DAGVYVLTGTLTDGRIMVEAADSDKVQIVLNEVSLTSSDNAPIYVKQADKVFLTLAEGTKNAVTDGAAYTLADGEEEPDAAIFSKEDLTINGAGALTVTANYKNGIASKDDLIITGGTITVTAVNDGLKGRDGVAVYDGAFVINAAEGDGIQSNNNEDTEKGWVSIDGGTFDITACHDGIQAETALQITDGTLTIKTGGGSANASTDSMDNERPEWGKWNYETAPPGEKDGPVSMENTESKVSTESRDNTDGTDSSDSSDSTKGIKAGTTINVTGGKINIDSSDDGVHANGDVNISGGTFTISSGDDGIHADAALVADNAVIDILKSYEGLEGMTITVKGGTIHITSRDDGINASGGNDGSSFGRPGDNNFTPENSSEETDSVFIRIIDGCVVVNASGDGIDANGSLYIDGGTVLVNGPTNNGNGPLDYNGVAEITGGIFVAAGSSGMAQNFSASSTQNSLLLAYSSVQKAGTLVSLLDESGKNVLSFTPEKDYQSIVISTPELKQGKTYTLYSGGSTTGNNIDGLYTEGNYSAGTEVIKVTLSGIATGVSDTGDPINTMGGPGGPGGGPKGGPRPEPKQ
ncbi:MAG: carbohydrate-binding domain-containing protein, partial [Dehalobacterium sp.]